MRAKRNPFWHSKILGRVSSHINISATYKPTMDIMYIIHDISCISLLIGIHWEKNSWNPCDDPPSAWMRQWPKLALWNPSLPPMQRSHDSPLLGLGRKILQPVVLFTCILIHLQQHFFYIPTCIEQVSSQVEGKLAPKLHFSEESWTLHPLQLAILDLPKHGSRTWDQNQSSYKRSQTTMNNDKREKYLLFENQTVMSPQFDQ